MNEMEKGIDLNKVIKMILNSEDVYELSEIFASTMMEEIQTDSESLQKIGYYLLKAVKDNNIDNLFIALCGWSLESLMKKSNLICDTNLTFHEKICEASFVSVWDGETVIETPCKVNMMTHEVFDIVYSQHSAGQVNELDKEFICIDGNEYPVYPKAEIEEDDICSFWYGENE